MNIEKSSITESFKNHSEIIDLMNAFARDDLFVSEPDKNCIIMGAAEQNKLYTFTRTEDGYNIKISDDTDD